MAEFKPKTSKVKLEEVERELGDAIEELAEKKARLAQNKYGGPYAGLFAKLYSEIYDIVFMIRSEFSDGFQWSDILDLVRKTGPGIQRLFKVLYEDFYKVIPDEEYEKFFSELVKFIYYEVIDLFKLPGWIKFLFGWLLKKIAAKKLGKPLADAFRSVVSKLE